MIIARAVLTIALVSSAVFGQDTILDRQNSMGDHVCSVLLFNDTGVKLNYLESDDNEHWTEHSIESRKDGDRCLGIWEEKDVFFKISTKRQDKSEVVKHYRLLNRKRYGLFNNPECGCWDVSLIEPKK